MQLYAGWGYGLSYIKCFCDPTEATVNDHVPAPPRKHFFENILLVINFLCDMLFILCLFS